MSLSKNAIASTYPLPVYNYRVTIDTDTWAFSEVSGLSVSYDKVVYKHGLSYLTGSRIIRAQQNEINITLKRGMAPRRNQLYSWFANPLVKDIFIDLCNQQGEAVIRWKVIKAQPLKMEGPSFSADGTSAAVESMEVIAQEIIIEYF